MVILVLPEERKLLFFKVYISSFGNEDGDGNEDTKKMIAIISKRTILHVQNIFGTILCRHCTTTTLIFYVTFYEGR